MSEFDPPDSSRPADPAASAPTAQSPEELKALEQQVIDVLKSTYDPEIPVNIYDLGMIYKVDVYPGGRVHVTMTLTSPMCPVAGSLPGEVETRIRFIDGVTESTVELVWDPPWDREMMSEAAKLALGFF